MVSVDNKTAPFGIVENMERSIRQADVKSGALKNTQVTLMRKKVSRARMKFEDSTFFKKSWRHISLHNNILFRCQFRHWLQADFKVLYQLFNA